ncbi:diguanylate cyclase (GGDEF)-like protein [Thiogranum longum]|uniref:Diguanylate cyclase DosC n=1 Tax=Thiogranum longum TaxID=1537524 RepID=A0A4R1HAF2_9GAMM|nr:diguanylate cyclase [Thiogranum longum]TCK17110.1 diguanylate cyclase (GGDEF)-like protein [Thiogranum longum]
MPARKPETPLCDQFGFDVDWRRAQLALIGLQEESRDTVRQLHRCVLTDDASQRIVNGFYEQLLHDSRAKSLLESYDIDRLKLTQVAYLTDFGVDFRDAGYFETRARVGIAHARVGLPLALYLSAFGVMQTLILEMLTECVSDMAEHQLLSRLVLKLTTLDIAVATEVYHRSSVLELDRSVKHLRLEQSLLRTQLQQDALTGVSSRTSLLDALEAAISRSTKTGQPLCIIMADLDHFKAVNDRYGHMVGDKVLTEVGARIRAALREFDLVGRYGGEEFVIVLENTSRHTALQVAERIRQRIAGQPIKTGSHQLDITISQGLALRVEGDDSQSLLQRADDAMYKAKRAGRNCVAEAD